MKETFLFKLLTSGAKHGRYSVKIKESDRKGEIILQNLRTKTKYEIKGNHQHPSIIAHLTINGLVKEFPGWIDLTDPASIKMVEKRFKRY